MAVANIIEDITMDTISTSSLYGYHYYNLLDPNNIQCMNYACHFIFKCIKTLQPKFIRKLFSMHCDSWNSFKIYSRKYKVQVRFHALLLVELLPKERDDLEDLTHMQ